MQRRLWKDFKIMIMIPFFFSRESQSGWGWEGPLEAVQFKPVLKAGLTQAGCSGLHHASDSLLDLMQLPHAFLGPRSPAGPDAPGLSHQGWAEGRKTSWPQPAGSSSAGGLLCHKGALLAHGQLSSQVRPTELLSSWAPPHPPAPLGWSGMAPSVSPCRPLPPIHHLPRDGQLLACRLQFPGSSFFPLPGDRADVCFLPALRDLPHLPRYFRDNQKSPFNSIICWHIPAGHGEWDWVHEPILSHCLKTHSACPGDVNVPGLTLLCPSPEVLLASLPPTVPRGLRFLKANLTGKDQGEEGIKFLVRFHVLCHQPQSEAAPGPPLDTPAEALAAMAKFISRWPLAFPIPACYRTPVNYSLLNVKAFLANCLTHWTARQQFIYVFSCASNVKNAILKSLPSQKS